MTKINIKKINRELVASDSAREKLIDNGDIEQFKKTYTKNFDIQNLNTGSYWDDIFLDEKTLAYQSPMTKDKIKTIAKNFSEKNITILDIGIGQGFLEELLIANNNGYTIHGIDISPHSIKRAKQLFKGKFIVGDVTRLGRYYPKSSFNTIVALELFEHINPSQLFKLYQHIHDLLKKNGQLILSIPINEHLDTMASNPSAHVRNYSPKIIKTELELSNFSIEKEYYFSAFNSNYLIKKLIAKILDRWEKNSMVIIARKKG